MNDAPVSAAPAFGFTSVKVSVALAPGATAAGAKALEMVGRESSVALAGAVLITLSELVNAAAGTLSV